MVGEEQAVGIVTLLDSRKPIEIRAPIGLLPAGFKEICLCTIPGVGAINATALLAAVGDGSAFARGRDLAAWLGLTPRQHSTGGKTKMLGISKRGNRYLRKQLIHGARAAMPHLAAKRTRIGLWLQDLLARSHPNVAVVALAAKLARIVWAVLRHQTRFEQQACSTT